MDNKLSIDLIYFLLTYISNLYILLPRFREGLKCLGLLQATLKYPTLLKPLFVAVAKPLDSAVMDDLFHPQFSEPGSNRYRAEVDTLTHWRDFLQDAEGLNLCILYSKFKQNIMVT